METTQTETKRKLTFDDEVKWLETHGFKKDAPPFYKTPYEEYAMEENFFRIVFKLRPPARNCELFVLLFGQIIFHNFSTEMAELNTSRPVSESLFNLAKEEIDSLNESFKHVAEAMKEDC